MRVLGVVLGAGTPASRGEPQAWGEGSGKEAAGGGGGPRPFLRRAPVFCVCAVGKWFLSHGVILRVDEKCHAETSVYVAWHRTST